MKPFYFISDFQLGLTKEIERKNKYKN